MAAKTAVIKKIPGTPIHWLSTGPKIKDIANVIPMVPPIIAIALVRCSSLVRSATKAVTAAETAPAP